MLPSVLFGNDSQIRILSGNIFLVLSSVLIGKWEVRYDLREAGNESLTLTKELFYRLRHHLISVTAIVVLGVLVQILLRIYRPSLIISERSEMLQNSLSLRRIVPVTRKQNILRKIGMEF